MSRRLYDQIPLGKLQAGETISAMLEYDDFPRASSWTMAVAFIGPTGPAGSGTITAGDNANSFALAFASSAAMLGGKYAFVVTASLSSPATVTVVERGVFQLLASPTVTTAAMTSLIAVNAVLSGACGDDQLTVSVDGMQLKYWLRDRGIDEIFKLQARFEKIVESEIRQMGGHGGVYAIQHHASEDHRLAAPWPWSATSGGR